MRKMMPNFKIKEIRNPKDDAQDRFGSLQFFNMGKFIPDEF